MSDRKGVAIEDRAGLRRLALQLAVQLPTEPDEARFVVEVLREIADVVHADEHVRPPASVTSLRPVP